MRKILLLLLLTAILFSACATFKREKPVYDTSIMDKPTRRVYQRVDKFLRECIREKSPVDVLPQTRIDTIFVDETRRHLDIYINDYFSYFPFRESNTALIYDGLKKKLGRKFRNHTFKIYTLKQPVEQLIPNFYRSDEQLYDRSRMPFEAQRPQPVVQNLSNPWLATKGLFNRNIALWHSHGWYYSHTQDRWEWQRPRLFQTVEDLLPMSFTLPYIIPMLEHAGAMVFVPRERDLQTNEIIVDNDLQKDSSGYFEITKSDSVRWLTGPEAGFGIGKKPYAEAVNPFTEGTFRAIVAETTATAEIHWIPNIPETGEYAVTIAYHASPGCVTDAHYTVYHLGGTTEFAVNQQIGGSTWIRLGKFNFEAGTNPEHGKVVLTNKSRNPGGHVTADAVRFGGGMGNIRRNGAVSGRPRFAEGARYYLQYAGMPDTLVYNLNNDQNDYKDDYQSRGEWLNYLKGAPFGPNRNRMTPGLGIPMDLSLAFHTDAGITRNDTTVGTLLIYSSEGADSTRLFPDGMSRFASRDFADILQTQIVSDLRAKYDPAWRRRYLWDKDYSEAYRPNVPASLLELLSHQNFLDMKFCLDPRFRFDASRAIYKAILKFINFQCQSEYVVQPLPVSHFQTVFSGERAVTLTWQPQTDPLEPTALAQKYILYTRLENHGFDNGILVDLPGVTITNIKPDTIYSFKVSAVNAGGESFPSEILSVCWKENAPGTVLIVNGFDRVCAPATVETETFAGFANFADQGVPDKFDFNTTGNQFNFAPASKWVSNDAPGHGASYGNFETLIISGNSFDFPYAHGKSIAAAGYSFVSASDESVMGGDVNLRNYRIVDLILGEERATDLPKPNGVIQFTAFPEPLKQQIARFCKAGGKLFVSGAYIGTDLFENKSDDHPDIKFAKDILKFKWQTNHAAATGGVFAVDSSFIDQLAAFDFNTGYHRKIYSAEAPDAIEPADSLGRVAFRYSENNFSAGVVYAGEYKIVALGFPFETILSPAHRDTLMKSVLAFFEN
ncbi:fibronectin type III domain-containing protein [candidate division KSB1 bacterium]|nr:fibronectin type III domain-containing protein [candidate division KSB1 bacterium]